VQRGDKLHPEISKDSIALSHSEGGFKDFSEMMGGISSLHEGGLLMNLKNSSRMRRKLNPMSIRSSKQISHLRQLSNENRSGDRASSKNE
jgi:hypothetical protein